MKGSYPLSKQRLHRALLELLQHSEVSLTFRPMRVDAGNVEYEEIFPPTDIRIHIDANNGDNVRFVIHELLHLILCPMFIGHIDKTLEEVCILGLENYMFDYVQKVPTRYVLWDRTIKKKLDAHKEDISLEELADRSNDKG